MPNQNPRNFASQRYYYDLSRTDILDIMKMNQTFFAPFVPAEINGIIQDEQYLEKYFSRIESDIKEELDKLDADDKHIDNDVFRIKTSIFLYDLSLRTERIRADLTSIKQKTADFLTIFPTQYPLEDEYPDCVLAARKELADSILDVTKSSIDCALLCEEYSWHIAYSTGDFGYVISDNPALGVFVGLREICIPFSRHKAIILRDKSETGLFFTKGFNTNRTQHMDNGQVMLANTMQFSSTNRYCFGCESDLRYTAKIFHATMDNIQNGRNIRSTSMEMR